MNIKSITIKYIGLLTFIGWFMQPLFATTSAKAQASTAKTEANIAAIQANQLVDKIIATVDGYIVLQSELDREYQYYLSQGGKQVADLKCKILEGLLVNKMLLARADIDGVSPDKEEIERALNHRLQYFIEQAGSEKKLEQYAGKNIQAFKGELKKSIKEQLTIEKMRNKIVDEVSITPADVKKYYASLPPNLRPYYPTAVEVRQLIRYPKVSEQDKVAIITQLKALKARVQAGESFAALAQEYSDDPGSAPNGGELGFWRLGELMPAYEAAALALNPNEIAEPVETAFGWHLIQLIERQGDRYNSRHILIKPQVSDTALQEATAALAKLRETILAQQISFEKAAIENSDDQATAQQGGLINNQPQAVYMAIEDLPADVFFIVDKLKPGEISEVHACTTQSGQEAVRMIYLKQRIPAHQANLQQDYEKIYQDALNAQKEKALMIWFKQVKTDANLKIDPAYQGCSILN